MMRLLLLVLIPGIGFGQIRAEFSDPNRPGTIRIEINSGNLTIRGTSEKQVILRVPSLEQRAGSGRETDRRRRNAQEVEIREENNVMRIEGSLSGHPVIDLQVPVQTSLIARSVKNGNVLIENVDGEIEVQNVNGNIRLVKISGSVIANTVNGRIESEMIRATAGKPMSFTTLNGSIQLTFPSDLKADFRLKADNGDIFTDFELLRKGNSQNKSRNQSFLEGSINGGGTDIRIHTVNGKIVLQKK